MRQKRLTVSVILSLALFISFSFIKRDSPLKEFSFSKAVYDRNGELLRLTLSEDEKYRLYTPLNGFSSDLKEATLLFEDKYFYSHPGVNPVSVVRAAWDTYVAETSRVGASTITMQTARMLFGINSKTPFGKIKQILCALRLEYLYTKDQILEAYLNIAPYGSNIEGAGAASLVYFKKEPSGLTFHEAITLSVMPESPARRKPVSGKDHENKDLINARSILFERWVEKHPGEMKEKEMFNLPMRVYSSSELPFLAPHYVDSILAENRVGDLRVRTTIDLKLQRQIESILKNYIERKKDTGVGNAAALLVDYTSMEVMASVGSADYFNSEISGQVNGTKAKRSPGSALKPFIYALAMDQGLIHPMTVLKDVPYTLTAYNPENFDLDFEGPMPAKDALIKSRNLPAIFLSRGIKEPDLYDFIKEAGVKDLRGKDFYGLALTLGGVEVTMEELARLYAMLGNFGELRELKFSKDSSASGTKTLLSPESVALTLDILKETPRPEGTHKRWTARDVPVYWKTGTSYAFRDAWTAGIFGQFALVVWAGNFSGKGDPAFIGISAAAPLFFEIFDAIKARKGVVGEFYLKGQDKIIKAEVCAASGKFPANFCPRKIETWFIPGKSPIDKCNIHREVLVDTKSRLRDCKEGAGVKKEVFEFWSTDVLRVFRDAGIPRRLPPPYKKECLETGGLPEDVASGTPPKITSPVEGLAYNVRTNSKDENIALAAVVDADAGDVFWFIDNRFVGTSEKDKPLFWTPSPGDYTVRAVDGYGRSDSMKLKVIVAD